jgi:hypothetical protein
LTQASQAGSGEVGRDNRHQVHEKKIDGRDKAVVEVHVGIENWF